MFKWTRLQLNTLPVIAIEADNAIRQFQQLAERVSTNASAQDISALAQLRQSFLHRIETLDRFYKRYHLDSTISIFHMIKLKLKRAVFNVEALCQPLLESKEAKMSVRANQSSIKGMTDSVKRVSESQKSTGKITINTNDNLMLVSKKKSNSKNKYNSKFKQLLEWEKDQTYLMEHNDFETSFGPDFSHHERNIEILFDESRISQKKGNDASLKKSKQKEKSVSKSPFAKKSQQPQQKVNESSQKTAHNSVKTNVKSTASKQVTSIRKPLNASNKEKSFTTLDTSNKKPAQKLRSENKKLATEGEQAQAEPDAGEFRFTIKMTKQQYMSLLKMKQMIKKGKPI